MQPSQTTWRPVPNTPGLRCRVDRHGDTQYAAYYTERDTGKQRQRTLKARTLTEAKKGQRALLAANDEGRAVAPSRLTVNDVAEELIGSMKARVACGDLAERTLETMEYRLRRVRGRIGHREVQKVTADTVAGLNGDLGSLGYIALRRVLSFAVRRGYIAENPCSKLEKGERPKVKASEVRLLSPDELRRLLDATTDSTGRALIATVALSGLRQSEALGLRWRDIDTVAGVLRVRYQLSRGTAAKPSRLVRLKTDSAAREVVLSDPLAAILREHRERALAAGRHGPDEFVFATRTGKPLSHRNATRTILRASDAAGLDPVGFHVLRHGFASALIVDLGLDPVQVARQLGHARPSLTLDTYAHLFDRARHAENMRERLAASGLAAAVARVQ